MKVALISNYLNHHLKPFSDSLSKIVDEYLFISTDSQYEQGFQKKINDSKIIQYDCLSIKDKEKIDKLIVDYDAVIFGSCPDELIDLRVSKGKLSFLFSERFFKNGLWHRFVPHTYKKVYRRVLRYKNDNLYVLSASAYLPYELYLMGFSTDKSFKWGYFPELYYYDVEELIKQKNKSMILWTGRFLDWKHPELAVMLAERLVQNGYDFEMYIIGDGILKNQIENDIKIKNLSSSVKLVGSKTPEEVRAYMEKSSIFIATSDYNEGWGAVINEAMNSACAVVASHATGATPYLITHNSNGMIFESKNIDDLYDKVITLINDANKRETIAKSAYNTMVNVWNADVAADRFIKISDALLRGNTDISLYKTGPCSKTQIYRNNWFISIKDM